jgi:hypothetical protein
MTCGERGARFRRRYQPIGGQPVHGARLLPAGRPRMVVTILPELRLQLDMLDLLVPVQPHRQLGPIEPKSA